MKYHLVLACCFCICVRAQSQTILKFISSDTANVNGYSSIDWPFDSTWVARSAYDDRIQFDYPTTIEIYIDQSRRLLLTRHEIHRDSMITSEYYAQGQLKVKNTSNRGGSLAWITSESYHPNGQLRARWHPSTDTLELLTCYYANGKRALEYWHYGSRAFNDWTEWYESGQVQLEAQYEPGPLTEEMKPFRLPVPIGEWRYYKPDGELQKVEVYEEGKLKETRWK